MAAIDPMYSLINTILDDKEVVFFLGGGASIEGTQDAKKFPTFGELIDNVLKDWGFDPSDKKKRFEKFLEVIKRWEKQKILPARLRKYLGGEPGLAHYSLAALSIALVGNSIAMLYLTTNYDKLLEKAFSDLERNPVNKFDTVVIPLRPHITGSEFQGIANNIEDFIRKGEPVILKLFGDLNSQSPIFRQDEMLFEPAVKEKLIEWMKKPMIFIGYSFSDKIIQQLLIAARGTSPAFLVTPSGKKVPAHIKGLDRVHLIEKRFSEFILDLFKIFKQINPSIIEKADKILDSIGFAPIPTSANELPKKKPSPAADYSLKIKPKRKKILILAANPMDTKRLRLDEEVREIGEGLRLAKHRDQFEISSKWAVRLRDLRRALLDFEPNIVHFTGHGRENGLLVEDELGAAALISTKALSGLFELFSNQIECVILSACYSARQAAAINKHINYVIGMRREIEDKASIEFSVGFYDALGAGRSVVDAFKFGRIAILQRFPDLSEHLMPVLIKKSDE
ncbi:MAG: SIR2 family protein [Candidatus Aminicenantes bacterium]|jgi:hypothetical protein